MRKVLLLVLALAVVAIGCGTKQPTAPKVEPVAAVSIFTPGVSTVFDVIRAGGVYVKTFADGTKLYRMPHGAPSVIVGPITVVCVVVPNNMQGPLLPGQCRENGNPQ